MTVFPRARNSCKTSRFITSALLYLAKGNYPYRYCSNYWMRLSRIWRILQIKEGVIHRGLRPRWKTSSEICRTLDILPKPNSVSALLFITGASQRLEPVIKNSLFLSFFQSRFQGPVFRCEKIVVIVTLLHRWLQVLFLGFRQTLENFSLHNKALFGEVGVPLHKTVSTTVIGDVPGVFLGVFPQLLPLFFLGWKHVPFLMRHHQVLSRIVLVWEIYPTGTQLLNFASMNLFRKGCHCDTLLCIVGSAEWLDKTAYCYGLSSSFSISLLHFDFDFSQSLIAMFHDFSQVVWRQDTLPSDLLSLLQQGCVRRNEGVF